MRMTREILPTTLPNGDKSSPNVLIRTGGTKSKSKSSTYPTSTSLICRMLRHACCTVYFPSSTDLLHRQLTFSMKRTYNYSNWYPMVHHAGTPSRPTACNLSYCEVWHGCWLCCRTRPLGPCPPQYSMQVYDLPDHIESWCHWLPSLCIEYYHELILVLCVATFPLHSLCCSVVPSATRNPPW